MINFSNIKPKITVIRIPKAIAIGKGKFKTFPETTVPYAPIVTFIGKTLIDLSKKLGKAFIVVEQNISLISQLNSDCLLMEKGVLTKKLNASEINSVEKARDLLSLHN